MEVYGDEESEDEERVIEEIFSNGGVNGYGPAHAMHFTVFYRIENHVRENQQAECPKIEEGSDEDCKNEVCCVKSRKFVVPMSERSDFGED